MNDTPKAPIYDRTEAENQRAFDEERARQLALNDWRGLPPADHARILQRARDEVQARLARMPSHERRPSGPAVARLVQDAVVRLMDTRL